MSAGLFQARLTELAVVPVTVTTGGSGATVSASVVVVAAADVALVFLLVSTARTVYL